MHSHEPMTNKYRVKLGHTEVTVRAQSADDAITQARRRLAEQMPRFYDVISTLDTNRFEIREAA